MNNKLPFLVVVGLCFAVFLFTFDKFNGKEKLNVNIEPFTIPYSKHPFNYIVRFVQLPQTFAHMGSMYVLGEHPPKQIKVAIHAPGDLISDHIRQGTVWESHIIDPLLDYLRRHPNLQFLDVGCNIGVFTINVASLRPGKREILAVDANERNCQYLRKSLEMNGYAEQVTIINNALDEERKENTLFIHSSNVGGAYIQNDNEFKRNTAGAEEMKIHSIFFDDLLDLVKFRQAVMKIDIEFSENRAFKKATRFFREMKIPVILFEWAAGPARRTKAQYDELITFFTSHGYAPYDSIQETRKLLPINSYDTWPGDMVWMLKNYNHTFSM